MTYIANTPEQTKEMLRDCGVSSIEELFKDIPPDLAPPPLNLPPGRSEQELTSHFEAVAGRNFSGLTNFLGGGFYDHYIPAAVDALANRSEFYTAYTPYQPEVSQGTLQGIYEYQSHICRLTSMEAANASVYDGGTALYEACQLALQSNRRRSRIVMDSGVNPVYRKMLLSYTANLAIDFAEAPVVHGHSDRQALFDMLDDQTAAVILQNPNFFGAVDNHEDIVEHCHQQGILVIQSVYPIAMAELVSPGEIGVDIVTGEGQSLGMPLSFGGPYLGFMACRKELARRMPGRIAGRTVDNQGREAFVLTLQAREQHIRRQKATSNICTNQALCALRAHIYLSLMGRQGLAEVAELCRSKAEYMKQRLSEIPGVDVKRGSPTFNEFTVELPINAEDFAARMVERGFAPGFPLGHYYPDLENYLLVAVTEKRTKYEMGVYAENMEAVLCR